MALVHDSIGDFVLFPRDQAYCDFLHAKPEETFGSLQYNHSASSAMQQSFADREVSAFEAYSSAHTYPSGGTNFYNAHTNTLDNTREANRPDQRQYTPSGSASPSIPNSLDHPPSILSSASGASGHSTTSSVAGSPYSLTAHNFPGQEMWTGSNQGLGIPPGIVHNDGFGQDGYSASNLDHELSFHDNSKYPNSFVGEFGKISLRSQPTSRSVPAFLDSTFPSLLSSFASAPQEFLQSLSSSPPIMDTSFGDRHDYLDPSVGNVQSQDLQPTHSASPDSVTPVNQLPGADQSIEHNNLQFRNGASFTSPTVPASAIAANVSWRSSAPPHGLLESESPSFSFYPQSPSFHQSNGRFIAPLQSSCWFPSDLVIYFDHLFSFCRMRSKL